MSTEESSSDPSERVRRPYVYYIIGSVVVGVILVAAVFSMRTPARTDKKDTESSRTDTLESVKSGLAKTTDYGTCKNAVQQLNLYLSQHPERKSPTLTADQRNCLTEKWLGEPNEIAEIEGGAFTLLDAYYLDECFLFRDAAQALEVNGLSGTKQAETAFRWVVRQVRLRAPSHLDGKADPDPVPAQFVLRRGWGTAEERALIYLALLRQLGIEGCLIGSQGPDADHPMYWACGALVDVNPAKDGAGDMQVLLFDHRMGMPLPGANGKEILTLSALCAQPELLKALAVSVENPYDVTPEMVSAAELYLVAPLSALAPRMEFLQRELLTPAIKGRFAVDAEESFKQFANATPRAGDKNIPVNVAKLFTGALRRFLPPDEGGTDKVFRFDPRALPGLVQGEGILPVEMTHKRLFEFELTSWNYLPALVGHLPLTSDLGQRPRTLFAQMFVNFYLEPRKPRDQVLRGRYEEAVDYLVNFRDQLKDFSKRLEAALKDAQFMERLLAWPKRGQDAYADLVRAERGEPGTNLAEARQRVAELWKEGEFPLSVLLQGSAAIPLSGETTYLLAMAKHEQAVRLQARVDHSREANPTDVAAARKAWENALSWWTDKDLAVVALAPATRWHRVEAYLALGNRTAAHELLADLTGDLTPLEKTARLYRASKLKDTSP